MSAPAARGHFVARTSTIGTGPFTPCQVVPWSPVISVELVPPETGGHNRLQLAALTAGSQHLDDLAQQSFLEQTAKQLQKLLGTLTERQLLVVATDFNTTYLERGLMAALKPAQKRELAKQGLLPG